MDGYVNQCFNMTLKVYQASFCLISKFQITLLNKGTGRLLFFFVCLFFKPHNLPIFFGFPILIDSKVKEIVTFLLIHVQKLQKMKTNKQKPECIQVPFFFFLSSLLMFDLGAWRWCGERERMGRAFGRPSLSFVRNWFVGMWAQFCQDFWFSKRAQKSRLLC